MLSGDFKLAIYMIEKGAEVSKGFGAEKISYLKVLEYSHNSHIYNGGYDDSDYIKLRGLLEQKGLKE